MICQEQQEQLKIKVQNQRLTKNQSIFSQKQNIKEQTRAEMLQQNQSSLVEATSGLISDSINSQQEIGEIKGEIHNINMPESQHTKNYTQQFLEPTKHIIFFTMQGMNNRMNGMERRMDGMEQRMNYRMDGMEQRMNRRMDSMEQRIGHRMDGMEQRVGHRMDGMELSMNRRMDGIEQRMNRRIGELQLSISRRMDGLEQRIAEILNKLTEESESEEIKDDGEKEDDESSYKINPEKRKIIRKGKQSKKQFKRPQPKNKPTEK